MCHSASSHSRASTWAVAFCCMAVSAASASSCFMFVKCSMRASRRFISGVRFARL